MASDVEIANRALTLLGEQRINSLSEDSKPARELKAIYATTRDALLSKWNWTFAMTRASLPPLADAPINQFGKQFQIPPDSLRIVLVAEYYAGVDLTNYVNSPNEDYCIEGDRILTDLASPLPIRYIKQVTDTTKFHATFVEAFAAKLADDGCEAITQSGSKRDRALAAYKAAIRDAVICNAIQLPPKQMGDDSWIFSRL